MNVTVIYLLSTFIPPGENHVYLQLLRKYMRPINKNSPAPSPKCNTPTHAAPAKGTVFYVLNFMIFEPLGGGLYAGSTAIFRRFSLVSS